MRTLERITVTGYKSIKELRDLKLGDLNVLIGANGAGKSNFLSLFKLLVYLAGNRLQSFIGQEGGVDYLLHFGAKTTDQIEIKLRVKQQYVYTYEAVLGFAKPNKLIFRREREFDQHKVDLAMLLSGTTGYSDDDTLGVGHEESKLPETTNLSQIRLIFDGFYSYHFQDTTPEARVKQNPDIYDNHGLKSDAANLASFLYLLKNHHRGFYDRILSTVKLAAPFIDDFFLQPMPENKQRIRLRWRHTNSDNDWDVSQLSDGTLRFICLTTLLLQPSPPSLIIIDEPELGLHPAAMGLLVEMLRSVATKSQVIISTQSVSMVNQFLPEEVIVVDRVKDESVFSRLNSTDLQIWLEDYSLGEIWEMNLVGGRP